MKHKPLQIGSVRTGAKQRPIVPSSFRIGAQHKWVVGKHMLACTYFLGREGGGSSDEVKWINCVGVLGG